MSHPQPPQHQPSDNDTIRYAKTLHTTAIITAVACPLLALLPPRKLDFYTFGLAGTSVFSANWLLKERTGRSAWQHIGMGKRPIVSNGIIEVTPSPTITDPASANRDFQDAVQDYQRLQSNLHPSVTAEVRSHREAWKVQQQKEIEEDIEEGKGFGDMIMDQIWEVWHWRKKGEDDE